MPVLTVISAFTVFGIFAVFTVCIALTVFAVLNILTAKQKPAYNHINRITRKSPVMISRALST